MAEFSEVMRQYNRLCNSYDCMKCPIRDCCGSAIAKANPDVLEKRVMEWAEAHPEPKYPTWAEWLRDMNIHGMDTIPADIAKKLGIKPKGASDD